MYNYNNYKFRRANKFRAIGSRKSWFFLWWIEPVYMTHCKESKCLPATIKWECDASLPKLVDLESAAEVFAPYNERTNFSVIHYLHEFTRLLWNYCMLSENMLCQHPFWFLESDFFLVVYNCPITLFIELRQTYLFLIIKSVAISIFWHSHYNDLVSGNNHLGCQK